MSTNPPRLTVTHGSFTQANHPNTATTATMPIVRSTHDDYREITPEQSSITSNHLPDALGKKYSLLPVIPGPTVCRAETSFATPKATQSKKQICNHFAPTQRKQLPALKRQNVPVTNAMDLDEDLPQCLTNSTHRAATYTSPGERIISPITRPSAPSPPTSAQIKRGIANAFVDGDDEDGEHCSRLDYEDSQLFNEHFFRYQQPIIMSNRRIDHYNHHSQTAERQPTIVINNEYDELTHSFNSHDFEP